MASARRRSFYAPASLSKVKNVIENQGSGNFQLDDVIIKSAEVRRYDACLTCGRKMTPVESSELECQNNHCEAGSEGDSEKHLLIWNIILADGETEVENVTCFNDDAKKLFRSFQRRVNLYSEEDLRNLLRSNFIGFKANMNISVSYEQNGRNFPITVKASNIIIPDGQQQMEFSSQFKRLRLSRSSSDNSISFGEDSNNQSQGSYSRRSNENKRPVEDEISFTVLESVLKPTQQDPTKTFAYFLLLIENPTKHLVEAKSFDEHAPINVEKLEKGKLYTLTGDVWMKKKEPQYLSRSKSELDWEYIFNEIDPFQKGNTDPAQEFYKGETATISELNEKIQPSSEAGFKYRLIKDVTLISGRTFRYIGCKSCKAGSPISLTGGHFKCQRCPAKGVATEFFGKFILICGMVVEDAEKTKFKKFITCFNDVAVKLLGKSSSEYNCDEEAESDLRNLLSSKLTLRVSFHVSNSKETELKDKDIVADFVAITSPPERKQDLVVADDESFRERNLEELQNLEFCENQEVTINFDMKVVEEISGETYYFKPYPMTSNPSGYALIINVHTYNISTKNRDGSRKNVRMLSSLFKKLNFKVIGDKEEYYTAKKLTTTIKDFKDQLIENKISACAVIVMGHGYFQHLILSDGTEVNTNDVIIEPFSMNEFADYIANPKLFIFNTCQEILNKKPLKKFPIISNAYFCLSVTPGYVSPSHVVDGSTLIDRFVLTLSKCAIGMDYRRMMRIVQKLTGEEIEQSMIQRTLDDPSKNMVDLPTHCRCWGEDFYDFFFKVEKPHSAQD